MIENYATRRGHETRSLDYDYEAVMADLEVIIFVIIIIIIIIIMQLS